jgi:hypothetical protein
LGNNTWSVVVDNVRFVDAQGAITTEDDEGDIGLVSSPFSTDDGRDFSFETFATAGDIELKLAEAADNPVEGPQLVDDSSDTENIMLLSTMLSAEGSDVTVREMTVEITASGSLSGSGDVSEQAYQYRLLFNGVEVDSVSSDDCASGTCDGTGVPISSASYLFDDIDYDIAGGASVSVRVMADMNNIDGVTFRRLDTLRASIDNAETDADDQNGDSLGTAELSGSVVGEEQFFSVEGPYPIFLAATATQVPEDGAPDVGTFVIKMAMVTSEVDAYVQDECGPSGDGFNFTITGSASFLDCAVTSTADEGNGGFGNFELLDGAKPELFTLSVTVSGDDAFVKVSLLEFDWGLTDAVNPLLFYDIGLDDFETDPLFLSSI